MLCADRSLVKLKGDQKNYWVMFDKCGFMAHLPAGMQDLLEEQDWTAIHIKPIKTRSKEDETVKGILIVLSYYDVANAKCALPHVASILLNEDATEMLEYRSDLAIDMQKQAYFELTEARTIREQGIHSKIVISDSGNVLLLYTSSSKFRSRRSTVFSNPFNMKERTEINQYEIRNSSGSDIYLHI